MTKRMPFGSRDPNVRSGDAVSIGSSIPSVEEALRQKPKKKKKMAAFSSSKTPLTSNRSKPPRYDGSKQLRRLKQSMATREQQYSPGKNSSMGVSAPTTHADGKTASVKRKEHSDDDVTAKKKPKASFVHIKHSGREDVATTTLHLPVASLAIQGEAKVTTRSYASAHAMPKLQSGVAALVTKRQGRNVAAEYLHNHRAFREKETPHPDLLMAQNDSTLHLSASSEGPVEPRDHLKGHASEEAMMDCTSDEESLNLSVSPASSPSQEDVEEDDAWVLIPPIQPQRRVPLVETEDMEYNHESDRRHSMTTLLDDSLRTPRLDNGTRKTQRAKSDSHRGNELPIETKDMLARAREAEPDDKVAVDALLNSTGQPYKGKHKRTFSPDISLFGKTIDTLEGSQSLSGSEVTLFSSESLDLQMCQKRVKRDTKSDSSRMRDAKTDTSRRGDAKSDMSRRRDAKSDTSRRQDAKSDDIRGNSPPSTLTELNRISSTEQDIKESDPLPPSKGFSYSFNERVSSISQPEPGDVDDDNHGGKLEGPRFLSGNEVTLLSPESLDLQMHHKITKRLTTLEASRRHDPKSEASRRHDAKSDKSRTHDVKSEDTRENRQSSALNNLNRISSIEHGMKARAPVPPSKGFPNSFNEHVSSIRRPEPGGVDEDYCVGSYKHNNIMISVMIPHPPLPSGWAIRISESKKLLVYSHPDWGSSWHCPVVMTEHSTEMIRRFLSQFFGHPESSSTEQEMESEITEMSSTPSPSNIQEDDASESGSQTSFTAASSAGSSQDMTHSVANLEVVVSAGKTGSELSLFTQPEVGVDSPKRVEILAATVPSCRSDSGENSTSSSHSEDTTHDVARSVTMDTSGASSPELSPSNNGFSEKEGVATEEKSSLMEVEELVSTVQFSRSESGTVIPSLTIGDGEELFHKKGTYGNDSDAFIPENKEYTYVDAEDSLLQSDHVDVDMHDAGVAESSVGGKVKPEATSVDSRLRRADNGVMPVLKPLSPKDNQPANVSGFTEAESMEVDQDNNGTYDEEAAGHSKDEGFEAEIDNVIFGYDHEDIDLSPQAKHLGPIKDSTVFYSRNEDQDKTVAGILASEHGSPNDTEQGDDGVYDDVPVRQTKHGGVEAEVSDLGEIDNVSPIQQSESFDNGSPSLPSSEDYSESKSEEESAFDKPLDTNPSRKNPIEHHALGHHDRQDENLSIASSLTGMTTRGDSRASKWRGFSHRVLHPPCPLCSLVRLEDLIKAAIARMKRRKAEVSRKSFRKEKRETATRLVFA